MWVSPHDETASAACDTAPEEIDVARQSTISSRVVDWPIEAVERKWAGLRTFTPARIPAYGFDSDARVSFGAPGRAGFGIQTAPAAARLAASLLLDEPPDESVAHIDPAIFAPRDSGDERHGGGGVRTSPHRLSTNRGNERVGDGRIKRRAAKPAK